MQHNSSYMCIHNKPNECVHTKCRVATEWMHDVPLMMERFEEQRDLKSDTLWSLDLTTVCRPSCPSQCCPMSDLLHMSRNALETSPQPERMSEVIVT